MMQLALTSLAAVEVGGYISIGKLVPVLIVLLVWARMLSWADKDAVASHMPREWINLSMLGGLILAFALFLLIPSYPIALLLFFVIMFAEVGTYLAMRQKKVGLKDLKTDFKAWLAGLRGEKVVEAVAGKVSFMGKNNNPIAPPAAESPNRAGYDALQTLLTDPLTKNAERIDLTPGDGAAQVKFSVDGVSYNATSLDRNSAAAAITFLKPIASLNIEEKRKPQTGTAKVLLDGKRRDLEISTAGSSAGEFLKILVDPKKRHSLRLPELGFSPEQLELVKNSVQENKGIVLVTAPKGQGLTSMLYALLRAHDAFLQHIQTIERAPDQDIEGITQNKLPVNASAAEEVKSVGWITSQEPDVLMINQIEDPSTPRALITFAQSGDSGKRVYIAMRASNTFDALAQWRKMVGDDKLAMESLKMVIAGRVMRKLCMACKVAYVPDPEQLRKLNMNPASTMKLFQARKEPLRDPKGNPIGCDFCQELRFLGRFGVYEVLAVDDEIRQVVNSGGSPTQLKAAFRKQKGKLLQEVALAAVEAGDTSVAEVKRVMEVGAAPAAPRAVVKPAAQA